MLGVAPSSTTTTTTADMRGVAGRIGEIVVRRSGRAQMIVCGITYDVRHPSPSFHESVLTGDQLLPASEPSFLQEVAALDPPTSSTTEGEGGKRAMYVLGRPTQKHIVAPRTDALLKREKEEREAEAQAEERRRKVKKEDQPSEEAQQPKSVAKGKAKK